MISIFLYRREVERKATEEIIVPKLIFHMRAKRKETAEAKIQKTKCYNLLEPLTKVRSI